jgi:phage terminase large subunit-like protein
VNSAELDPSDAADLDEDEIREMMRFWLMWQRPAQTPPSGDWVTWLMMGGRGSGKTRAGAEWVRAQAAAGVGPIALVGETITEAVAVMVDGVSGIMAVTPPWERPRLSGAVLHWPSGVVGTVLGATDPERFRGPQFAAAWCDEIGKWPNAEAAWDMLQFGLRLGDNPCRWRRRRRARPSW